MWVFSKTGFVNRKAQVYPRQSDDPCQVREDLEQFIGILDEVSGSKHSITETPDGDYRFRTTATKKAVAQASPVKSPTSTTPISRMPFMAIPTGTGRYGVWSAMYGLQRDKLDQ